jgi:hypothetical protein
MRYTGHYNKELKIEQRAHTARIIDAKADDISKHAWIGNHWRSSRSKVVPSSAVMSLDKKTQKALLAGARSKRERKVFSALIN